MLSKLINTFTLRVQILYLLGLGVLGSVAFCPRGLWWLADLFILAPLWVLFIPLIPFIIVSIVLKSRKGLLINALSSAVIFFGIMGFNIPYPFSTEPTETPVLALKVINVNMGNVKDPDPFLRLIADEKPDIILFQELYQDMQVGVSTSIKAGGWDLKVYDHMGIASRFKVRSIEVNDKPPFGQFLGYIVKYEIETPAGLVYLLNVHLETLRKGIESVMAKHANAITEMQRVTDQQEAQSLVATTMAYLLKPLIVAGDLNMPRSSPIFKTYWSKYQDAFLEKGFGFGFTKHSRWHGVRIDHILHDANWKTLEASIGPDIGGDHHPVMVRLLFTGLVMPVPEPVVVPEAVAPALEASSGGQARYAVDQMEWNLDALPRISFNYKIPAGVPVTMGVKTAWGDWLCLAKTQTSQCAAPAVPGMTMLTDDGRWHEVGISVKSAVQGDWRLPKSLTAYEFNNSKKDILGEQFFIEDLKFFDKE